MRVKLRLRSVKSWRLVGLVLLLLVGSGIRQIYVRGNYPPYSALRWHQDQENRVLEAVFRYQIRENRHNDQICFLSVRKTAPDRAVMQRFLDLPFVLPFSPRFQVANGNFRDRTTGLAALYFWIDRVDWDTDTEVRIAGGGAAANKSGDSGEFTAVWQHGIWLVTYDPRARY